MTGAAHRGSEWTMKIVLIHALGGQWKTRPLIDRRTREESMSRV